MVSYKDKLKDVRWQKKRLEVLGRDKFRCMGCLEGAETAEDSGSTITLHVHHTYYKKGLEPWEYPLDSLITLCEGCHSNESADLAKIVEAEFIEALKHKGFTCADFQFVTESMNAAPRPMYALAIHGPLRAIMEDPRLGELVRELYHFRNFTRAREIVSALEQAHNQELMPGGFRI